MNLFENVMKSCKKILDTSKLQSVNEWAESNAFLSAESSAEVGRWKSIPYQVEILNCGSDPDIEGVVVKKSARVGWTKILLIIIGYFIEQKPAPILAVQPTVEDAEGFSKEEIAPFIRDVPSLRELVSDAKAKDGSNSLLHKLFPMGLLSIIGANSPRGFRRISRKIVAMDEVSGYPKSAGTEGDPVRLAIKRTDYYIDRKILMGSTPTLKDECSISRYYEETDQRNFFVPCPCCGFMQSLDWTEFKIPEESPAEAYFECKNLKCKIEHKDKRNIVEKGEWRATAISKKPKWVGFYIWAAYSYSPNATWSHIALEYLEAKRHGREALQTFVNTVLGMSFDDSLYLDDTAKDIQKRAEAYPLGTAPDDVVFCTAGVDIQDNRIAIEILGWGENEECWIINYEEIFGNPVQPEIWKRLDDRLDAPILHSKFNELKISATAIDSGHHTHDVYNYVRERKKKNVIAIKGSSQKNRPAIGKPSPVDVNYRGNIMKKGVHLYSLGVDTIKSNLYSRLKIPERSAFYVHFSSALPLDFFMGIQSEKKSTKWKRNRLVTEWVKLSATVRNEPLDCWVYAFAAKEFFIKRFPKGLATSILLKELNHKAAENLKNPDERREDPIRKPRPKRRGGFK